MLLAKISTAVVFLLALINLGDSQVTETCLVDGEHTRLSAVVERLFIDLATEFFSVTAFGKNGFPLIDATLKYSLFDLFEERYGPGTSTAEFRAGLIDITSRSIAYYDDYLKNLAVVIGLINAGNYDAARAETMNLIRSDLLHSPLIDGSFDYNRLTIEQSRIVYQEIKPLFITILNSVESIKYERYLSIAVGTTLALVMDVTGSMSAEISAASDRFVNIIETTTGTVNQPLLYVLSPYNDPEHGPVTVTSDPDVIITAIKSLVASGGGDAPELAMIGIYSALLASSRRSVLFHITDAPAKDAHLESQVIALALIRKIRIVNLLTREIGGENGQILYNRLSQATGGLTTVIKRTDIESVTQLFTAMTAQGQVILRSDNLSYNPKAEIQVDDTAQSLMIRVAGYSTSSVTSIELQQRLRDGSLIDVTAEVLIDANGLYLLKLDDLSGWGGSTLMLEFGGDLAAGYSLEVTAASVFGANLKMVSVDDSGNFKYPRQFVAGTTAFVEGVLFGDTTATSINKIQLQAQDGRILTESVVNYCDGEYFTSNVFEIPVERFFIILVGLTNEGNAFRRSDACLLIPLLENIGINEVVDIIVEDGSSATVPVTFFNRGTAVRFFTFDATDQMEYLTSFNPKTASIGEDETSTINLEFTVPAGTSDGVVSRVTVTGTLSNQFVYTTFNILVRNTKVLQCPPLINGPGANIKCTDGFNDGSVCQLVCDPQFVVAEATTAQCNGETWTTTDLRCNQVENQECQLSGDPHYITFDGNYFDFMGTCVYTMVDTLFDNVTETGDKIPFTIQVENEHRFGNTLVSWFKRAFFKIDGVTYTFLKNRQILVDGVYVEIPYSAEGLGLKIEISGSNVVLTIRKIGLEIRYNGNALFVVQLAGSYANKVEGLCGNFDGNPNNDLALPDGTPVNANEFGSFYKSGGAAERCQNGGPTAGGCKDLDAYTSLCGLIEGECFKKCRLVIPVPNILQNCIFDMCATEGSLEALDQAIDIFAQECQLAGISICDWRDETGTVPECPVNAHYENEGVACPDTCLNPKQSTRCIKPKVAGCVCDDGFVLSGLNCIPVTECGCFNNGVYYKNGAKFLTRTCDKSCECQGGELKCEAFACPEGQECKVPEDTQQPQCVPQEMNQCQGTGDPHFTTFDGTYYDFQGICKYTFVKTTDDSIAWSKKFSISIENEHLRGNTLVSFLREATFSFHHDRWNRTVTIVFNNNDAGVPQVTAYGLYPEGLVANVLGYEDDYLSIQDTGNSFTLKYGYVTVFYRPYDIITTVPSFYKNKLAGMCGSYNSDPLDDFTNSTGGVESDINKFVESFIVDGGCLESAPEPIEPCTDLQKEKWSANNYCGVITDLDGIFGKCLETLDLTQDFNNCLYDLCQFDGDPEILSRQLSEVTRKCNNIDPVVECDWRAKVPAIAGVFKCPPHSTYSGCASGCPNTCVNPTAESRCAAPEKEGCICNSGYILHAGECIKEEECGCLTPEYGYVKKDFVGLSPDCSERCVCYGRGKYVCEKHECVGKEECLNVGITRKCIIPSELCIVNGGYVRQFDGNHFIFNTKGRHTFAKSTNPLKLLGAPEFKIDLEGVDNDKLGVFSFDVIASYRFVRNYFDIKISAKGQIVTVNDRTVMPGSEYDDGFGGSVQVFHQGFFVTVVINSDIIIRSGFERGVIIQLSGNSFQSVDGICGSWDDDKDNDVFEDYTVFINLHYIPSIFDDKEPFCSKNDRFEEFLVDSLISGAISSAKSGLDVCESVVSSTTYKLALAEILSCNKEGFLEIFESSFINYWMQCIFFSEVKPVIPVRENIGIKYNCPLNSHYSVVVPYCVKTCSDRDASRCEAILGMEAVAGIEGCVCDEGFIWSGYHCVLEEYCGCLDKETGTYYNHGDCYTKDDCSRKCQCLSGSWSCEDNKCYKNQVCVEKGGVSSCLPKNKCMRPDNGGCAQICNWNEETDEVTCDCYFFTLRPVDPKTCRIILNPIPTERLVARKTIKEVAEGQCVTELNKWRDDYKSWKADFNKWQSSVKTCSKETGKCSAAPRWAFEDELLGYSDGGRMCGAYFTRWFNTDKPDGCGDDESIERIRDLYAEEICEQIILVESRLVSHKDAELDIKIRTNNVKEGFICDNSDQNAGIRCPDYEVRFVCLECSFYVECF